MIQIYDLEIRDSDVFVVKYPKSGERKIKMKESCTHSVTYTCVLRSLWFSEEWTRLISALITIPLFCVLLINFSREQGIKWLARQVCIVKTLKEKSGQTSTFYTQGQETEIRPFCSVWQGPCGCSRSCCSLRQREMWQPSVGSTTPPALITSPGSRWMATDRRLSQPHHPGGGSPICSTSSYLMLWAGRRARSALLLGVLHLSLEKSVRLHFRSPYLAFISSYTIW